MAVKQSRTMGPTSDLVVLAPWKKGIIGADEAIMPRSRFIQTFDGIYDNRVATREAQELPAFADPVEQIEQVHSYRVVAREDGMLLAVTYDFGWDGYMRALWGPGGAFLDLLLANCEGYTPAREASLSEWSAWVRRYETVSNYFYAATTMTVGDLYGLGQSEVRQREAIDRVRGDRDLARFSSTPPGEIARQDREFLKPHETTRQALRILTGVYRLTRLYGADVGTNGPLKQDAITLLRFAKGLLRGWNPTDPERRPPLSPEVESLFARELAWFDQDVRLPPKAPIEPATLALASIQRGIIKGFGSDTAPITHGAALYLAVTDAVAARGALAGLSLAAEDGSVAADGVFRNLAFSFQGLRRLRLDPAWLDGLPPAFQQGAAARAGQVGDVRSFHPSHWQPLALNWPQGATGTIDIGQVDAVIQLRTRAPASTTPDIHDAAHPLHAAINAIAALPGIRLLSFELLGQALPEKPGFDHFGVRDGVSQPTLDPAGPGQWSDQVAPGELLLGYPNDKKDPVSGDIDLKNGSFLAIRRMPMRRAQFEKMLDSAIDAINYDATPAERRIGKDIVVAKIIGRQRDGKPLVASTGDNDFTYASDKEGNLCPRQSHARRVNPREDNLRGEKPPRIMRRGMSFGTPWRGPSDDQTERGSLFMAYCASLEEQYETLLRWVNGGNSTRIGSYMPDPLCSPPRKGRDSTYRFIHQRHGRDNVYRCELPPAEDAMVQLSWSLYLFAPSLDFIRSLPGKPVAATSLLPPADPQMVIRAAAKIEALLEDARRRPAAVAERQLLWREMLDEPGAQKAGFQRAVWSVIRDKHQGVLVADGQVLVGSHAAVIEVLRDDGKLFSVKGAGERISQSIEKFHLGLDAHTIDYQREGPACNEALRRITAAESHDMAKRITVGLLRLRMKPPVTPPVRLDLVKDLLEPVTAEMAAYWFDLPDGGHIEKGVSTWIDVIRRKPVFPGDFWNSSRHAFNPFESAQTRLLAAAHGKAILAAAEAFIGEKGRANLQGTVSRELARAEVTIAGETMLAYPTDHDLARGLVGAMLGWIATTLGNGARWLDLLLDSGDLARLQIGWRDRPGHTHADAVAHFFPAMVRGIGLQPVPECKWRTVDADGVTLGGKSLPREHRVILGLGSAAADQAASGIADSHIWFGMANEGAQPPHGCPGRDMALGMLLGVVAGLAETARAQPGGARFVMDISPIA